MVLRSYANPVHATAAAEFLGRNGITAHLSYRVNADGIVGAQGPGVHDVLIDSDADVERARRLAWYFDHSLPRLDPGWEDQTTPDLSRLEARFHPLCPGCGATLDPAAVNEDCPSCRRAVDLVDLIVQQHGPDALGSCYPEPPAGADAEADDEELRALLAEAVQSAHVRCPACNYDLAGLDIDGVCPECGRRYSKVSLISAGPA